jgi:hypothetical protein
MLAFSILTLGCTEEKKADGEKQEQDDRMLQDARGEESEIVMVISPDQWNTEVGEYLRELFTSPIEGVPQPEPRYTLRRVKPSEFNNVLKSIRNLVFVATLDNNKPEGNRMKQFFTDRSLEKIEQSPDLFSFTQQNVYAKGQDVLYLFGRSDEELINNIKKNEEYVQNYFEKIEQQRLEKEFEKIPQKGIMDYTANKLGLDILIPVGFDIASKSDNHIWIRKLDPEEEFNFWIVRQDYTDESVFEPSKIKSFRNELGEKYITDADIDSLHMTTQDEMPLISEAINLNGEYALMTKGLWKYSDNSRGGAFRSILMANEDTGELYYIEGYVDNPGQDKREAVRLIETILKTASFPEQIED